MITALATVVSVTESKQGNLLELSCEKKTSCSHCASKDSCGTGMASKAVGNRSHKWELYTGEKVKAGQLVEIGLPEKSLIQYASIVYLIPLLMLMLGGFLGQYLFSSDSSSASGEGWVILAAFFVNGCRGMAGAQAVFEDETELGTGDYSFKSAWRSGRYWVESRNLIEIPAHAGIFSVHFCKSLVTPIYEAHS